MIDRLRIDEGHTVAILCDNPEAATSDEQAAVEIHADWTKWEARRFYGVDWQRALQSAFETMLHETGQQP